MKKLRYEHYKSILVERNLLKPSSSGFENISICHCERSEAMTNDKILNQVQSDRGKCKKAAFTLAEVLITLTIVGVVAALTIPTLVANIQDKVTKRQIQVTQRKISQGVEDMQVHGELLDGFSTTREFVNGLSKYMKISQICDNNNLRQCWTYDKVKVDDEGTEVEVSKQKDGAKAFHMAEGEWGETIGVTFGNGVQMLLAYKKNCAVEDDVRFDTDKDSGISGATKCLAGVWELNGAKGKNKYGDDVLPFNAGGFGGKACAAEIGNLCITTQSKVPTPVTKTECLQLKANGYPINKGCESNTDYWAGAVKMCKDLGGRLPTEQELTDLATYLYNKPVATTGTTYGTLDTSKLSNAIPGTESLNFNISSFALWSNSDTSVYRANTRYFFGTRTNKDDDNRNYGAILMICVNND